MTEQVKRRTTKRKKAEKEQAPMWVSTGSTLLDLAIAGERVRGGGIPAGILVEIFGPASSGKTVLLCEIAGAVRRADGEVLFRDPEARLNEQFAALFGLDVNDIAYSTPSTVPEVFQPIREWDVDSTRMNAAFADSLAALTTKAEEDQNDQYGMRRAKEFSQECRLTCRVLAQNNILMVCSNQVRQNLDAGPYGQKYKSPGGEAIGFYSSLRLRAKGSQKMLRKRRFNGKEIARTIGVQTEFEVHKSSIGQPYRGATVYILWDYGIDDVRANLQYVREIKGNKHYIVGDVDAGGNVEAAISYIEENELETQLREEVIDLWEEVEKQFRSSRKAKRRDI